MPDRPPASDPVEVDAARAAILRTRRAPWLTPYRVQEFERMRCFLSYGGQAGGAVKPVPGGLELVSVFNHGGPRGAGAAMIRHLVGFGADRLSCIGPELRRMRLRGC